jgi:hypothetical protein
MASISPPITTITGISATGGLPNGSTIDAMAGSGWGGSMLGREDMRDVRECRKRRQRKRLERSG